MGTGRISAPDRWAGMQGRTLFPARTWETQPGNQCRRQYINPGDNRGAGSRDCSPGAYGACDCVKGETGKDGAWKNGDQDGLEPGSSGGRTHMLAGGGFRGRSDTMVGHQEGLQTGGYERKADEPGEGSVQPQNTEQKSSRRPERLLPGTEVCPLGLCYPLLVPCFLLLKENRGRVKHSPGLSGTRGPFPMPTHC